MTFRPSSLAKQSRQGKPITELFFPSFPHDPGHPVVTLKAYEDHTHRGGELRLFLALIKPYKAVTSSTITRWLKSLLEDSVHEIRHKKSVDNLSEHNQFCSAILRF